MLCDAPGCEKAYHMLCLRPPLTNVPEEDWFCPCCNPPLEYVLDDGGVIPHHVEVVETEAGAFAAVSSHGSPSGSRQFEILGAALFGIAVDESVDVQLDLPNQAAVHSADLSGLLALDMPGSEEHVAMDVGASEQEVAAAGGGAGGVTAEGGAGDHDGAGDGATTTHAVATSTSILAAATNTIVTTFGHCIPIALTAATGTCTAIAHAIAPSASTLGFEGNTVVDSDAGTLDVDATVMEGGTGTLDVDATVVDGGAGVLGSLDVLAVVAAEAVECDPGGMVAVEVSALAQGKEAENVRLQGARDRRSRAEVVSWPPMQREEELCHEEAAGSLRFELVRTEAGQGASLVAQAALQRLVNEELPQMTEK